MTIADADTIRKLEEQGLLTDNEDVEHKTADEVIDTIAARLKKRLESRTATTRSTGPWPNAWTSCDHGQLDAGVLEELLDPVLLSGSIPDQGHPVSGQVPQSPDRRRRDKAGPQHLTLGLADLERIHQRKKAANKELLALLKATRTTLTRLNGIGPSAAARLLVEVGDITRFPDRNHFASWNGTAPIDASSGEHTRHRLSRAGNRQINRALHIMAIVQLRNPSEGRTYYDRRKAAGKTSMEAMRSLKRRLSDIIYRTMLHDAIAAGASPGATGQRL